MKIGLIDSGIGGLTVLATLIKKYPNHQYVYYGDTIHMPYGEKTKEEIVNYGNNIIKFLENQKVDLIILACGTLSSNVEWLKSSKKIIDLVSPLKNKLDHYNHVSIMATPLSVKTNTFGKYINTDYNLIPCSKLVPIIENNDYQSLEDVLKEYLQETTKSDALVLGCTHYPIIKEYIKSFYFKKIYSLDEFIDLNGLEESESSLIIYYSYLNNKIIENTKRILNMENLKIERKCLND